MGLDQLLELTSAVSVKLLPILGVIVFIFIIIFLRHLIKILMDTRTAMITLNATLETAHKELKQLDGPLNTLSELSETVDAVHEASKHAVRSTLVTIIENFSSIKDWFLKKDKKDGFESTDENINRGDCDGEQ